MTRAARMAARSVLFVGVALALLLILSTNQVVAASVIQGFSFVYSSFANGLTSTYSFVCHRGGFC